MTRRSFLVSGAAALLARAQEQRLGRLTYLQEGVLWVRDLPEGEPRKLKDTRPSPPEPGVVFSQDGRRYAYGEQSKLFVSETGGTSPKLLLETSGGFRPYAFTHDGNRLVFWMTEEDGASVWADGIDLYIVDITAGALGISTLVHRDMLSLSPMENVLAASAGGGRESTQQKRIALVHLDSGLAIRYLTDRSMAALTPAWSPDRKLLAYSAGPDAEFLYEQRLAASGQKTIRVMDPAGDPKRISVEGMRIGMSGTKLAEQSLRERRIWVVEPASGSSSKQLTNDAHYQDEKPLWSRDGTHILFARIDGAKAKTIWLMRNNGSELRQVAGPLSARPGLPRLEAFEIEGAYYGYTDWSQLFDYKG